MGDWEFATYSTTYRADNTYSKFLKPSAVRRANEPDEEKGTWAFVAANKLLHRNLADGSTYTWTIQSVTRKQLAFKEVVFERTKPYSDSDVAKLESEARSELQDARNDIDKAHQRAATEKDRVDSDKAREEALIEANRDLPALAASFEPDVVLSKRLRDAARRSS